MKETLEGSVSAQQDKGTNRRLGTSSRPFLGTPAFRGDSLKITCQRI